jgi:phage gp46-like protein
MRAMPADLALRFDAAARRCRLGFAGRDLALDASPATALLISIGTDRRARPDDALPWPEPAADEPLRLDVRRGWCGDALDGRGQRVGCRLWLLDRAKETESTRRRAEAYTAEGIGWLAARGLATTASAAWLRRGVLAITARAGRTEVTVARPLLGGGVG